MPRDLHLVTRGPVGPRELVEAAADVDGALAPRALFDGWVLQLLDLADQAVLSVQSSRGVHDPAALVELLGPLDLGPGPAPAPSGPGPGAGPVDGPALWYTQASAPWTAAGEVGVAVWSALARRTSGWSRVEEGR